MGRKRERESGARRTSKLWISIPKPECRYKDVIARGTKCLMKGRPPGGRGG